MDCLHTSLPKIHSSTKPCSKVDSAVQSPSEYVTISRLGVEAETQNIYVDWASCVRFEYYDLMVLLPAVTGNPSHNDKPDEKPIMMNIEDQIPNYLHTYNMEICMLMLISLKRSCHHKRGVYQC